MGTGNLPPQTLHREGEQDERSQPGSSLWKSVQVSWVDDNDSNCPPKNSNPFHKLDRVRDFYQRTRPDTGLRYIWIKTLRRSYLIPFPSRRMISGTAGAILTTIQKEIVTELSLQDLCVSTDQTQQVWRRSLDTWDGGPSAEDSAPLATNGPVVDCTAEVCDVLSD